MDSHRCSLHRWWLPGSGTGGLQHRLPRAEVVARTQPDLRGCGRYPLHALRRCKFTGNAHLWTVSPWNTFRYVLSRYLAKMQKQHVFKIIAHFLPLHVGVANVVTPMYLTEIAPFNYRGAFGVIHQLAITLGIFAGSVFGIVHILGWTAWNQHY